MLRFVNPSIVTPQAYMLVDKNPSKHPRRTLTLIAKMLQNLANKPTYSKEMYMMSLNGFVESNKARINKFFNELCEVSDFYEALEMEQYVALSKKEISLNISLNEMFNTQGLLQQHKDALVIRDVLIFVVSWSRSSFKNMLGRTWICNAGSIATF